MSSQFHFTEIANNHLKIFDEGFKSAAFVLLNVLDFRQAASKESFNVFLLDSRQ